MVWLKKMRLVRKLSVVSNATAKLCFQWPLGELTLTLTAKYLNTSLNSLSNKNRSSATKGQASLKSGLKNSGTGSFLKRMTNQRPRLSKLERSLTATNNSKRNGRKCMTNNSTHTILHPILNSDHRQSNCTQLRLSTLDLAIMSSKNKRILTVTGVLLFMSCAWVVNSLKCFASVPLLVSSSKKILMATMSLSRMTKSLTTCLAWSSRIATHPTAAK